MCDGIPVSFAFVFHYSCITSHISLLSVKIFLQIYPQTAQIKHPMSFFLVLLYDCPCNMFDFQSLEAALIQFAHFPVPEGPFSRTLFHTRRCALVSHPHRSDSYTLHNRIPAPALSFFILKFQIPHPDLRINDFTELYFFYA